mmetsp:Transcript_3090/g.7268  ORF Transcript_3090/g.7268 Transcript_3090/m.7268 type:complete len:205 (-) Transcript_3090:284-898(-)
MGKEVRILERLKVCLEGARFHDHRVSPREQNVRHQGMLLQVIKEGASIFLREAQITVPDKLCPAKAVSAIGVASLRRGGEEKHGLCVLVLHAREILLLGSVELLLAGGVRVQVLADLVHHFLQAERITCRGGLLQKGTVVWRQHLHRWENQTIERILRNVALRLPVNELLHQVRARLEREDERCHLDVLQLRLQTWEPLSPFLE